MPNVVFPTAVDVRGHRIDVYYGAADERIATATTQLSASVLLAPAAPWRGDLPRQTAIPGDRSPGQHAREVTGGTLREDNTVRARQGNSSGESNLQGQVLAGKKLAGETLARVSAKSDRAPRAFSHILVALDGSNFAEQVLASVEPLAKQFGSRVTLLRAVTRRSADGDRSAQEVSMGATDVHGDALRYLAAMQLVLESRGLKVETDLPEGAPSDAILQRGRELGVDLIALTTHGRTGMDRVLLGSVAEEVTRLAPCPVLLVRVLTPD